jgi:hypothetical protein
MVPVMRRRIALTSVLGLLLAGMGCNHIAGRNDCQFQPGDYDLPSPTPPYVATPATTPTGIALPTPGGAKVEMKVDDKKPDDKKPGNF